MKVLVACETSGTVRNAFIAKGHDAWSCDLEPAEDNSSKHFQCDIRDVFSLGFDLMVAHPPCTHLASSGAKHFKQKILDRRQKEAIDFFMLFTKTNIPRWCIENPQGIMSTIYRKPDQIFHPYHFGDPAQKTTHIWLHGLPKLVATHYDAPLFGESIDKGEFYKFRTKAGKIKTQPMWFAKAFLQADNSNRAKDRRFIYPGFAAAIANQWNF